MPDPHIIVIGGGVNGAAIARDAAQRGLRVSLFEKNDFGCGTSWASSKLIHGGLRYLEHFEFGLVRTSLRERNWLLSTYPHNSTWLPFVIPVYQSSPYSRLKLSAGLRLYSWLDPSGKSFDYFDHDETTEQIQVLNQNGLRGSLRYYDGHCPFPERLVLDLIKDSVKHGATVKNHTEITGLAIRESRIKTVTIRDTLSGSEYEVPCDYLINAAGPWIDSVLSHVPGETSLSIGVKGSHLVFSNSEGLLKTAVYAPAKSDGRPFFIIPWLNFLLVGTTEVRDDASPESAKPSEREINYLLNELHNYLPGAELSRDKIILSFSGIRALAPGSGGKLGSISRELELHDHRHTGIVNLMTVIGGKLTTFRDTAERAVNSVVKSQQWTTRPCQSFTAFTDKTPTHIDSRLPGQHLQRLYGGSVNDIAILCQENPALSKPLTPGRPDIGAQVVYAVRHEWARTMGDVMLRRTSATLNSSAGLDAAGKVADLMAKELGWSDSEREEQTKSYEREVQKGLLSHR